MPQLMKFNVSSSSNTQKTATAIYHTIQDGRDLEITAIGAGALNQAIKASIIAKGLLSKINKKIILDPSFDTVLAKKEKTSISAIILNILEVE